MVFLDNNIEQIYFDNCSFSGGGLHELNIFQFASRIGLTRCGLNLDDLESLLYSSNPYEQLEILDLSGNNFGNKRLFVDVLRRTIFQVKSLEKLIILDNGFDQSIVPLIKYYGGPYIREIIL